MEVLKLIIIEVLAVCLIKERNIVQNQLAADGKAEGKELAS